MRIKTLRGWTLAAVGVFIGLYSIVAIGLGMPPTAAALVKRGIRFRGILYAGVILTEQGPQGADEAARYGIEVCKALAAVHGAGLVHRDVKTSNVMREQGGRIILMDFGSVTEQAAAGPLPGASDLSGTPLYLSPEHLRGEDLTPASDIYSLGVVLYRLASGRFPVEASTFVELLEKHRRGSSVPLRDARPDLPASFVQVVERALSFDPRNRFASPGALERALAASVGSAASVEPVVPTPEPAPRPHRWTVWLAAAAALAVLDPIYAAQKLSTPHTWHSAEVFLYVYRL